MKTHRLALALTLLAAAAILAACAAPQNTEEVETSSPGSYDQLVAALRENGSAVEALDPISQPFFVPQDQVIAVDGYQVQIFEYPSEEDASTAAATISSDGSSIGTTMVSWIEAPHFFWSRSLIVLYVGEEDSLIKTLQLVLGPQIAGR